MLESFYMEITKKTDKREENLPEATPSQQPQEVVGKSPSMQEFEGLRNIIYAILIVLFLGFVGLLVQYFTATQATFQDLKDQIITQNDEINNLTTQLEIYSNGKIKPN